MANSREANRLAAKNLIEKGKKQGSLTLDEIMGAFSNTELDKDKVENLYETLGNLGIEILETKTEKVEIDFSADDDLTLDMDSIDDDMDEKLKKEHISDAKTATVLHNQVGQEVRATIKRVGGTLPENQPTPEKSIDEITKEQLKKLKSQKHKMLDE